LSGSQEVRIGLVIGWLEPQGPDGLVEPDDGLSRRWPSCLALTWHEISRSGMSCRPGNDVGARCVRRKEAEGGFGVNRKLTILPILVLAAASTLSACAGESPGVVQGQILVFNPVVHPGTQPTSTPPTASFTTSVDARAHGNLVASQRVLPGESFRFALPPGSYVLSISQEVEPGDCDTTVTIRSGHTTDLDVRCSLP